MGQSAASFPQISDWWVLATLGLERTAGRGRVFRQLLGWTNGTLHQVTATVRAAPVQFALCTMATERAFEAAYHRLVRRRRQIFIAAFAVRPEFEHGVTILALSQHLIGAQGAMLSQMLETR